jgi:hypothetical protein
VGKELDETVAVEQFADEVLKKFEADSRSGDFCPVDFAKDFELAMANPEEGITEDYSDLYLEQEPVEPPREIPASELESVAPGLAQAISEFNASPSIFEEAPSEEVSAAELDSLLTGLDQALQESLSEGDLVTEEPKTDMMVGSGQVQPMESPSETPQEPEPAFDEIEEGESFTPAPFKFNLQVDMGNEVMSEEEIAALLAAPPGTLETPAPHEPKPKDENEMMSDEEIAALIAASAGATAPQVPSQPPASDENEMMSDADIAALLLAAEQNAVDITTTPEPAPGEDEIEALFKKATGSQAPAQSSPTQILDLDDITSLLEPEVKSADVDKVMSDDEIQQLMAEAEKAAQAETAATPVSFVTPEPVAEPMSELSREATPSGLQLFESATGPVLDPDAVALVPAPLAIAALAVPLKIEGEMLHVLVAEPFDRPALEQLGQGVSKVLIPQRSSISEVIPLLKQAYASAQPSAVQDEVWHAADVKPSLLDKVKLLFRRSS